MKFVVRTLAQTLIRGMLCKDTTRRLTAMRVLNDAWFTVSRYNIKSLLGVLQGLYTYVDLSQRLSTLNNHLYNICRPVVSRSYPSRKLLCLIIPLHGVYTMEPIVFH
jgi:hypothetical protein